MHGGEGQRERESPKPTPHWVQSPRWVLIPWSWDHDLSWNQELDTRWTASPGALHQLPFLYYFSHSAAPLIPLIFPIKMSSLVWIQKSCARLHPLWHPPHPLGAMTLHARPPPYMDIDTILPLLRLPPSINAFLTCFGFWHAMPGVPLLGGPPYPAQTDSSWLLPHLMGTLTSSPLGLWISTLDCFLAFHVDGFWIPKPSIWTLFSMVLNFYSSPLLDNLHTLNFLQVLIPLSPYSRAGWPCHSTWCCPSGLMISSFSLGSDTSWQAIPMHECPSPPTWASTPHARTLPCMDTLFEIWHLTLDFWSLPLGPSSMNAYLALLHWVASRALVLNRGSGVDKNKEEELEGQQPLSFNYKVFA